MDQDTLPPAPLPDALPIRHAGSSVRKRSSAKSITSHPVKINYPKKRVSVACEVCRARKTRCDARRPACSFCGQLGIDCVYRRNGDGSTSRGHEEPSKNDIVARLGRLESLIREKDAVSPPNHTSPPEPFSVASFGGSASPTRQHREPPPASPFVSSTTASDRDIGPPPLFGYRLDSLSRLGPEAASLPALQPLCSLDVDAQLETELFGPDTAASGFFVSLDERKAQLDLSPRLCWSLEQAFSRDVLPWFPIIEQHECAQLVARVAEGAFPMAELETGVALLVLALGSFARESGRKTGDGGSQPLPGLDYFHAGRQVVNEDRDGAARRYSIMRVQCDILITFYFLFSLKPILASEVLSAAGLRLLMLLQLRSRPNPNPDPSRRDPVDPVYHEKLHRAYWTCYLLEHELQAHVSFSARLLQERRDFVPLPLSNYEEPGMYWFLSEIALRGICSSMHDGVAWNDHMIDAPMLVEEVTLQLLEWHSNLALPVRFPLDDPLAASATAADPIALRPLLDPHKVFLRAQFYAVQATLRWPFVVQLLTAHHQQHQQQHHRARTATAAAVSLRYAVLHVYAVEPLLQDRHLMLFANIAGLFCVAMLLLCAHGLPQLVDIQHPGTEAAVRHALRSLRNWSSEPNVNAMVLRVEDLARAKGIRLS